MQPEMNSHLKVANNPEFDIFKDFKTNSSLMLGRSHQLNPRSWVEAVVRWNPSPSSSWRLTETILKIKTRAISLSVKLYRSCG
jgi:hypothetical protein